MAPNHAELTAEIDRLLKEQLEDLTNATFMGWTREGEAAHQERTQRIEALLLALKDGLRKIKGRA